MNLTLGIIISSVLALLCARWYESNKLFWILFTSLMVGIVGGSIYTNCIDNHSKNETLQEIEVFKDSVTNQSHDTLMPFADTTITACLRQAKTENCFNEMKHDFILTNGHTTIWPQPPRFNHFRLCTIDSTTHHDSEAQ